MPRWRTRAQSLPAGDLFLGVEPLGTAAPGRKKCVFEILLRIKCVIVETAVFNVPRTHENITPKNVFKMTRNSRPNGQQLRFDRPY